MDFGCRPTVPPERARREFTTAWWNMYGAARVRVSALLDLCEREELLSHVIGDGTTRAQQVRLGRALQRARDRILGELQIVVGGSDRDSRTLYALHWVPYRDDDDEAQSRSATWW
jgi:hypothetical protein